MRGQSKELQDIARATEQREIKELERKADTLVRPAGRGARGLGRESGRAP